MADLPKQWHVYIVDLERRVGTKPGKQRPCIVVQPSEFSEAGLESSVVLPLTTKLTRGNTFPLRVRLPKGTCHLKSASDALIDQILAWDNKLFREDLGLLPEGVREEIRRALLDFLDL